MSHGTAHTRGVRAAIAPFVIALGLTLTACAEAGQGGQGTPGESAACQMDAIPSSTAPEGAIELALPAGSPSEVGGAQITVTSLSCEGETLRVEIDLESPDGGTRVSLASGDSTALPGGGRLMLLGLDGEGDAAFALITD